MYIEPKIHTCEQYILPPLLSPGVSLHHHSDQLSSLRHAVHGILWGGKETREVPRPEEEGLQES